MEVECINTRLLARSPLAVRIVKVDSPSLFWAQLKTSNEDFRELLEDLTRRMTRKGHMLRLFPDHIIVGEAVAIREGKGWQRGIITDVNGDRTVAVSLRDWGRNVERPCFEVHILEDRFRQMRWQGIPCGLGYTAPFSGSTWSRKAKDLTKFLINQQEGYISILGTVRDEGALVELKIRSGGNARQYHEINFKETLIKLGYAQHSDNLRTGSHPLI
ncbi:Tudor domain-containing protein 6 [Cyphomyrmex costatus]|uniref:Tudor domain-containing protein 6 n=1 Tax=Cyphomyrmex costatus TaxID=456900 RepID=A0A151IM65_9HYME|nr:Tudor domain-containing protein 6 [Cyphomyrmex costatus]